MWNGIQIGTQPLSTQTHQHILCLSESNCAQLARVTNLHHFLEECIVSRKLDGELKGHETDYSCFRFFFLWPWLISGQLTD